MTALAIIRTETGIIVASDGAAYDDAGICRVIRSKVQIYPEISTVIASRGAALAQKFIEDTMFWGNTTLGFDALVREMPDLTRGAAEYTRGMAPGQTDRFSLFLCGWSEERERWETYVSRSYPWDLVPDAEGRPRTAEVGDLIPLSSIHLAPEPYPAVAEGFGLVIPPPDMTGWSAAEVGGYGILSVCASRACLGGETGSEGQCCVGGFVQVTTLMRESVTSQIVHRWPDPVGEVLDFRRGDPSPWHQWPVEMLPTAEARP